MFKVFFYTCLPLRAKRFVVSLSLFGSIFLCKDKRKREKKKNHFILPSANCLM